jgi:geranylgeranyl diphosphate synthase type II
MVDEFLEDLDFATTATDEDGASVGTEGLVEAMRYSLLAGGKRIRPVLCLATCEGLGHDPVELLPTAAALELIHTYSLIHDDLPSMDDDDLRRGRPTCHRAFGEDAAILAGDALFAEAIRLIAEHQIGGAATQVGIIAELAAASGVNGMVGGQFLDLRDHGRASADALRQVHLLKTGRLIASAVRCALVYAQPDAAVEAALRSFAVELGLLFQIVDDILDVAGDEDELGKAVGADERRGKVTYVSFYGLERAQELASESHLRAVELLAAVLGPTEDLAALTELIFARQS